MAAVTPATFRAALYTRMRATADVEFTDAQLDEAGRAAFNAAFPALHAKSVERDVAVTYDSDTAYSTVTVDDSSRVYKLRDVTYDYYVRGWEPDDGTTIRRLPGDYTDGVDVYSIAPINYPTSSVTVPDEWLDALYTYAQMALVEMMLADFTSYRGYKANSREGMVDEGGLQAIHTNLFNKWTRERDERAMSLPVGIA